MKLLRFKKQSTTEVQNFHLVEKTAWEQQANWSQKMMNFHIHTYCGKDRIMAKGDEFVVFNRTSHGKKICPDCYQKFKSMKAKK